MAKNIHDESFDKPLFFGKEEVKLQDIKVYRTPFMLEKDEFIILTKSSSELKDWYKRLFQVGVGVGLTIISKMIYILYQLASAQTLADKGKIEFSLKAWEVISLFIAFGGSLVLYLISLMINSEKDKLISRLKKHFNK